MTSLQDSFLLRAALAAIGLALAAAPLGCFIVWRRMAYFGEATAHAGVLGVALSIALEMPIFPGVLFAAIAMSLAVSVLTRTRLAEDTALGVLAHSALAFGLVAVSLVPNQRLDLTAYLLGDILSVSVSDLFVIWCGSLAVLAMVFWRWNSLLLATLDRDLAKASGVNERSVSVLLTLGLAITVAVAIKIVGVLLVAALLVIPPASSRPLANSPERMALVACGIGVASALIGVAGSWQFDTPTGPSIVVVASLFFGLSMAVRSGP